MKTGFIEIIFKEYTSPETIQTKKGRTPVRPG